MPTILGSARFDLGSVAGSAGGVRLGFTDAVAVGSRVFYLAAAEDSANAIDDGGVLASQLGVIEGDRVRASPLTESLGKAEGLAFDPDDPRPRGSRSIQTMSIARRSCSRFRSSGPGSREPEHRDRELESTRGPRPFCRSAPLCWRAPANVNPGIEGWLREGVVHKPFLLVRERERTPLDPTPLAPQLTFPKVNLTGVEQHAAPIRQPHPQPPLLINTRRQCQRRPPSDHDGAEQRVARAQRRRARPRPAPPAGARARPAARVSVGSSSVGRAERPRRSRQSGGRSSGRPRR